jgi:two-component system, LytTR family, response regulator
MLSTIIIDDEPAAREKLQLLIEKYCADKITLKAVCKSPEEGIAAIAKHNPDLIFLDVEMPSMTGFDMLRKIARVNFEVIFTTAHDHYAIKAIKFSALDYLLKPIDLEQLLDAINKAVEKKGMMHAGKRVENFIGNMEAKEKLSSLSVPTANGFMMMKVEDIVWCGAVNYYTVIHLKDKSELIATRTLKEFEELLTESGFIRIHHSHMINVAHLKRYIKGSGGQVEMSDGKTLDVSRRKKDELLERIGNG